VLGEEFLTVSGPLLYKVHRANGKVKFQAEVGKHMESRQP